MAIISSLRRSLTFKARYSVPSLESPPSVRATISLFQSANNQNFNTVFAYWYSTTGGICNAPMCIDYLNKPIYCKIPILFGLIMSQGAKLAGLVRMYLYFMDKKFDLMNPDGFSHFNGPIFYYCGCGMGRGHR